MSYHHGHPPVHYTIYSPHTSDEDVHYVPAYEYRTPTKGNRRRSSYQASSRVGGWYSPAGSPPPDSDRYRQNVTPSKTIYVSYETRRASSSSKAASQPHARPVRRPSQPVRVYDEDDVHVEPRIINREPPQAYRSKHGRKPSADSCFYFGQEQIHREVPSHHTRTRSTTTTTTSSKTSTSPKARPTATPSRQATTEDAAAFGIPRAYSIKNWDPDEEPIVLLGSVFDAHSLGKWIYDWTVYKCGASTPMAEMAGDLWLLLIKLAGKIKRAEDSLAVRRIRQTEDREMVEDFLASGRRLMQTFKRLLKDCEQYMWRAAKTEGSKTMMGKNAGTEFVDSIFGRDRYLQTTEKLMNSFRMWTMRFDVNCEDLLRRPSRSI